MLSNNDLVTFWLDLIEDHMLSSLPADPDLRGYLEGAETLYTDLARTHGKLMTLPGALAMECQDIPACLEASAQLPSQWVAYGQDVTDAWVNFMAACAGRELSGPVD